MWLRGELFYYILYARVYSSSLDFYVIYIPSSILIPGPVLTLLTKLITVWGPLLYSLVGLDLKLVKPAPKAA